MTHSSLFLIAGEASGDVLGGALMTALGRHDPKMTFHGIGGPRMEAAGLGESLFPMEDLSLMGIFEILPKVPHMLARIRQTVEAIERLDPEAVVTIDAPEFCFRVARALRKRGRTRAKLIHMVAPSVWAWRPGRAAKVAEFLDGLICLFPFEPPYFEKAGLKAMFAGHPVVVSGALAADGKAFRRKAGIAADALVLGLLPGSRTREIEGSGRVLAGAVARLKPDHVILPTLPSVENSVRDLVKGFDCPVHVVLDPVDKWDAFAACDVAAATSGTVGLELAAVGVPHVIGYQMNPLTWAILRRVIRVPYAHLANIILNHPVVPEFLQDGCNEEAISTALAVLVNRAEARRAQQERFREVRALIGASDPVSPSDKAARYVLDVMSG